MRRYVPEVRALYERVRRPAITILVGLGFTAPMGFSLLRPSSPASAAMALEEGTPTNHAPGAGGASSTTGSAAAGPASGGGATATNSEAEGATESGTARAEEKAASSKTESARSIAARYARQYRIPVSLAEQIYKAAVAEGIEPRIAFGLVQTESSFRRTVISSAGAVGYTQLLPSTARWIEPGTTRSQLFHPQTNLRVGFKYLNYLKKKYNGNMRLALTAYNRGPGTVDRLLKQGRNPENGYATKVLRARG